MFYGWMILTISMVAVAATSPGQSYLIGKFSSAIEADLGISETTLTAAYGLAMVLAALPLPLVGRFADRFGPRALAIVFARTKRGATKVARQLTQTDVACLRFAACSSEQSRSGASSGHSARRNRRRASGLHGARSGTGGRRPGLRISALATQH